MQETRSETESVVVGERSVRRAMDRDIPLGAHAFSRSRAPLLPNRPPPRPARAPGIISPLSLGTDFSHRDACFVTPRWAPICAAMTRNLLGTVGTMM